MFVLGFKCRVTPGIKWMDSVEQFLGMLRVGVWLLANGACGISDAAHLQLAGRDAGVAAKERAAPLGGGPALGLWSIITFPSHNAQQVMLGRGGNNMAAKSVTCADRNSIITTSKQSRCAVSCLHTSLVTL